MTFGERLKKARIASGINQADAAKKLEMSRPTLSAIEAGKRQVLASEILKFAELYNVPVLSLSFNVMMLLLLRFFSFFFGAIVLLPF